MAELKPEVRELLDGANFVSLATLTEDGSPHATTVWAGMHDGHPYFFTQTNTYKAKNIDRDARVAITVFDRDNPYRTGQLRGEVVEKIDGDEALRLIDLLSQKYTGADFPYRQGRVYLVEVASSRFTELQFDDTPGS
jgi:PPOX class probable F420-dependent enzyme